MTAIDLGGGASPAETADLIAGRWTYYVAEYLWYEGAPLHVAVRAKHGGRIVARLPADGERQHEDPSSEQLAAVDALHRGARAKVTAAQLTGSNPDGTEALTGWRGRVVTSPT